MKGAHFFNEWLEPTAHFPEEVLDYLLSLTNPNTLGRCRAERGDAKIRRKVCMGVLVANIAVLVCTPNYHPAHTLVTPTAYTPRRFTTYHRPDYPRRGLRVAVNALAGAGLVTAHPYVFRRACTRISICPGLVAMLPHNNANMLVRDASLV